LVLRHAAKWPDLIGSATLFWARTCIQASLPNPRKRSAQQLLQRTFTGTHSHLDPFRLSANLPSLTFSVHNIFPTLNLDNSRTISFLASMSFKFRFRFLE